MCARPIIGISGGGVFGPSRNSRGIDRLLSKWIYCTSASGGIPVVVPNISIHLGIDELLDAMQGFVVAAERDAYDAWPDVVDASTLDPPPDLHLVQAIADRRIPFLGIGLGFQLLNLALGGTIAGLRHDAGGQPLHVYPHNPRHALDTTPESIMDRICGPRTVLVTSSHCYTVDRVAEGLKATAVARDGVVEALEWASDDWVAMAVQFQPDMDDGRDLAAAIFEAFLDEVIAHTAPLSVQTESAGTLAGTRF